LDTNRPFALGQTVTVIYDPADPGRVRTVEDENLSPIPEFLFISLLVSGVCGIPFSLGAATGWFRRYLAVRRTGWHPAFVWVSWVGQRTASMEVRYSRGGEVSLRAALSTHIPPRFTFNRRQQAWVGGRARAMVVVFPRDGNKHPRLVPGRARTTLTMPARLVKVAVTGTKSRKRRSAFLVTALVPVTILAGRLVRQRRRNHPRGRSTGSRSGK
jgi:hypothetical protein